MLNNKTDLFHSSSRSQVGYSPGCLLLAFEITLKTEEEKEKKQYGPSLWPAYARLDIVV